VYRYDDLDKCTMTGSDSSSDASLRSEVAIFWMSAIAESKGKKCSEVMGQCE
jgi:hypothetical protein